MLATDPQGSQSNAERFVEVIREMTNAPIRYVVYSHHHGDHILGGEAFPDDSQFIAHRNAEPYLETMDASSVDRFGNFCVMEISNYILFSQLEFPEDD